MEEIIKILTKMHNFILGIDSYSSKNSLCDKHCYINPENDVSGVAAAALSLVKGENTPYKDNEVIASIISSTLASAKKFKII